MKPTTIAGKSIPGILRPDPERDLRSRRLPATRFGGIEGIADAVTAFVRFVSAAFAPPLSPVLRPLRVRSEPVRFGPTRFEPTRFEPTRFSAPRIRAARRSSDTAACDRPRPDPRDETL